MRQTPAEKGFEHPLMTTPSTLAPVRSTVTRGLNLARRLGAAIVRHVMQAITFVLEGFGYRLMRAPCVDRVGHLALDFDSYLKENSLLSRRIRPIFLLGDRGFSRSDTPANPALMEYWRQYITIIAPGPLQSVLALIRNYGGSFDDLGDYAFNITKSARAYEVQGKWRGRPPLLTLTDAHRERGQKALRELGLPDGAWFVCLHAREGGYSPMDEHHHSYRNVDVASYDQAVATIVSRGGWCVRTGDKSMRPLAPMPGVIDYALSPLKSDWLDLYLCAACRFFLGDTSGLFNVAGVFGRMSVLTNMVPLTGAYSPFPGDIAIPKQMLRDGRRLTLPEGFSPEIGQLRLTAEFESRGITFVDNSSEEIAGVVSEAFDRLEGGAVYTAEDEVLQSRFRGLLRPGHTCFPSSSRIGRDYLRARTDELLNADGPTDRQ
jgi:putative glycosyltransferase (TIGR04372 family)